MRNGRRPSLNYVTRKKMDWNKKFLDLVKLEIPMIEAPTPSDFWDTANFLRDNKGMRPEEAARRVIERYK